jgi:hypothetical protein
MLVIEDIHMDLRASKDGNQYRNQTQSSVQTHHNIDDPSETFLSQVFDEP